MKQLNLLFLLLLVAGKIFAQNQVEVRGAYDNDRMTFTISSTNKEFCDYHIKLNFKYHNNISSMPNSEYNAPSGTRDLCRIEPRDEYKPVEISYGYTYFKGRLLEKINGDFLYLLPVKTDKTTRFSELKSISEEFGKKGNENFYAFSFTMDEGDTVFASRRGVVSSVNDEFTAPIGDYSYVRNVNSVEIFHEDGTFAIYENFNSKGIIVKEGQFVEADQAIGCIGKIYDYAFVSMKVFYLGKTENEVNENTREYEFKYVNPKFAINELEGKVLEHRNKYTAVKPESVIIQELSKREIKKRNALKK